MPTSLSAYGLRVRYRFDQVVLDVPRRELLVKGVARQVQPQVFDLLCLLVQERGRVLSKAELFERLWPDAVVSESSIQRSISLARSALGESGERIRTHARRGYAFVGEVETDVDVDVGAGVDVVASAAQASVAPQASLEVRYANSGGVHIAYSTHGQGPVDVLLILGWSMPFEALGWHPRLAAMRDALGGVGRLVVFDKRGTGLSDREAAVPTLEQRAEDLMAVLDAVGSRRVLLVGISEGGPLAMQFAAEQPRRVVGLLLIGAFARMAWADDHRHGWSEAAVDKLRRYIETRWGSGATAAAAVPSLAGEPGFAELCARIERGGASPGAALRLLETNLVTDVRGLLPKIHAPTSILHAREDQVVSYEHGVDLAQRIASAHLVTLAGKDHLPVRELGRVVAAASWLQAAGAR